MTQWKETLDVSKVWNSEMVLAGQTPTEAMQAVANMIDGWRNKFPEDDELHQISEELTDAANENDGYWFDAVWDAFYDWADANHIWVKTY